MRWNLENIVLLFRTICETQNLTINVQTVANNWPAAEGEERPTPKAIKDQLSQYKKTMKPGATLTLSFGTKEQAAANSPAGTPRKRKPTAKGASGAKKTKVVKEESESETEVDE